MPHPQLRVTNQDREQVVEHVKAAYAEGRLDKHEMDERLHLAMTARTHADLVPIMNDLYGTRPAYVPRPPAYRPAAVPAGGDRVGAASSHLFALLGLFVIGPLLMMVTAGRTSPYIRKHAVEALNFHLTVLGATVLLPFTVVGFVLLPVIWVVGLVLCVVGGVSALACTEFRYPLTIRLVK
ncbi:DUF1707 and DUF4870 domain-containing protein [Microbispora bryophytorum]|uniref:DUF1707 domain-containing protein n=1 Tax=Microbispora bryophytorum TaxID=1460882 RepID=A0A8H9H8W7_9ACTN|nr:DUF1707 and DUF4870 domain-containing protein [Microbispora bryophytorum]MBD3138269.1 DUF1707 and DUF4870 domain-containing protein [Microbispora bryophytorum]TQS04018.1 DUF1707 and DUF4870 domain-containing protein [Microbispora bryophytorum]GGO25659.1 hypothetical protein GCM10011574_57320 [Microbispora bryophytorum]